MKRCFLHLALFLVLGAVINYSLAMGIIWFSVVAWDEQEQRWFADARYQYWDAPGLTVLRWVEVKLDERRILGLQSEAEDALLPRWSKLRATAHEFPSAMVAVSADQLDERMEFAAGWPMRALVYRYVDDRGAPYGSDRRLEAGIELSPRPVTGANWPPRQDRAIPVRMIGRGMAINTLVFAALAGLVWPVPQMIQRTWRRRAGRCVKCRYSREGLADSAPCPECGAEWVRALAEERGLNAKGAKNAK